MRLKYITVEKTDSELSHVLSKIRRELGRAYYLRARSPLLDLTGNYKILELMTTSIKEDLVVKIEGPSFIMLEVYEHFKNGGAV